MANYCGYCGNEVNHGDVYCENCGKKLEIQNQQGVVTNREVKRKKGKWIGIIAAILVLAIIVVSIRFIIADSYKDVAGKYADAMFNFDYDKMKKYLAYDVDEMLYDYIREAAREEDYTMDELIEDFISEFDEYVVEDSVKDLDSLIPVMFDVFQQMMSEEFDSYKTDYEITDTEELKDYEIEAAIEDNSVDDYIQLSDYFDLDKVKKGYEVTVEVTFETDGEVSKPFEMEMTVVKYKGKWKVINNPIVSIGILGRIIGLN